MNKHNSLDAVFRNRLRDLEAEAPMHLWEHISQKRDWKHRVLNQARQKKPMAVLVAALVAAGLSWGIWSLQQPSLGNFPIPLSGALAAADILAQRNVPATLPAGFDNTENSKATVETASPDVSTPVPSQEAVVASGNDRQPASAALPAVRQDASSQNTAQHASPPAVRPVREESLFDLPSPLAQQPANPLSIFDAIFSPDPKCAEFGKGHWNIYLDALVSPDLTFRQLQPRDPEFEEYVNTREETESNLYAFSGALRLSLVSDKGLALRTGLNYSQINERFSYINGSEEIIETINNYDQAGNIISTDTIVRIGTRRKVTQNHYRMLDIPFLLGYELTANKLKVSVNGGAYLNLLFRQKGDFLSPQDLQPVRFDSGDPDAYPAFKQQAGLGWYGSVGFAYQAGHNLQLVVEPHIKVYPKSVTRDQYGVQQRYMTTGLFIGLRQML